MFVDVMMVRVFKCEFIYRAGTWKLSMYEVALVISVGQIKIGA